ncbi:MAG: 30S ribosomal protein S8e [Candidatus Nanoarchaeia archaeon]|jgi:small subunit ribosomal protein S8e
MSIWLQGSKRKPSGGKYHVDKPKKKMHVGRSAALTRIGEPKIKKVRTLGGNYKLRAQLIKEVNIYDAKKKKMVKAIIEDVMLNPANRHYVRMDVITKGAVLKTNLGFVKVTNRPGQEGIVNGLFTEYTEEKGGTKLTKSTVVKKKAKKHSDRKEKKALPEPKKKK